MNILFIVPCGTIGPSGAVRVFELLPYLEKLGVEHTVVSYSNPGLRRWYLRWPPRIRRLAKFPVGALDLLSRWATLLRVLGRASHYDLVFVQWIAPPVWYTKLLCRFSRALIYDIDDAVFLAARERVDMIMRSATLVIAGSEFIRRYAVEKNDRVHKIASSVPVDRFLPRAQSAEATRSTVIRLGWIGSASTMKYLVEVGPALRELGRRGCAFELLLAGTEDRPLKGLGLDGLSVTVVPFYDAGTLPAIAASFDIGISPLPDLPNERGKCAMKLLIYMAASRPVICSPVGENATVVENGVHGLWATGTEEWIRRLEILIRDAALRAQMGDAGRRRACEHYATGHAAERVYLACVEACGAAAGRGAVVTPAQ